MLSKKTAVVFASAVALALSFFPEIVFADAISDAFTSADGRLGTVITGVISLAAIATGIGLIFKFLSK
jgi:hypothetical protein